MLRFADPGGRVYGAVGTSNANLVSYWTTVGLNGAVWSLTSSGGRYNGTCIHVSGITNGSYLLKTLDTQSTWGIALAFKCSSFSNVPILSFNDTGNLQVDLRLTAAGQFQFTRNGTNIGSVSTTVLSPNAWYHIEVKVTIHPSAGSIECRINGVAVIGPTGSLNTRATANSSANQFMIGSLNTSAATGTFDFDDIIVWDTQATDAAGNADIHDFTGDCGVYWLLPSGAGTTTQFTPDSGSNYARVADTTPDTTSYVDSSTVNQIDTYAITDALSTITSIKSLQVVSYAKKTDTGSRGIKSMVRTASTNYAHTNEVSLPDSFIYLSSGWGSNPNTTSAWTLSDVNGLEAGQKVTS